MLCLACAERRGLPLCGPCERDLGAVPAQTLASGVAIAAVYRHSGAARRLVHRLKYQGLVPCARVFALRMVPLLPAETTALIPIPRARLRKLQYGVDPALELAEGIGPHGRDTRRQGIASRAVVATSCRSQSAGRGSSFSPGDGRTGPGRRHRRRGDDGADHGGGDWYARYGHLARGFGHFTG